MIASCSDVKSESCMALEMILKEVGLSDKEAAVYLGVLELGQASVLRIAQKAGVKRPTAYITLSALQEKGFVEVIPKGTTTLYQAVDPEKIHARFLEKIKAFGSALPELRSILNVAPGKPRVRFYEGRKSITALYENEISRGGNILAVVSIQKIRDMISPEKLTGFTHLMKAHGTCIRDILEDSLEAREYVKEKNRLCLGETKFLPADMNFETDMLVYGATVAMVSPKTLIAVVIEDAAISNACRRLLEYLWASLPTAD